MWVLDLLEIYYFSRVRVRRVQQGIRERGRQRQGALFGRRNGENRTEPQCIPESLNQTVWAGLVDRQARNNKSIFATESR